MAERTRIVVVRARHRRHGGGGGARVQEAGARSVRFACLVASPEGVERFHDAHPDVPIYTCAVDPGLDARGFIVPGLGDVGDRLYGTE